MFEKLSPHMESIVKRSQEIAREYEQDYVGTEHLLLAILQEGAGLGAQLLLKMGIDMARTRAAVDKFVQASKEDTWVFGRLPGTPHFRNVMARAIEEARQFESKTIGSEHLLLALAREEGSVAQAALDSLGAKAGTLRANLHSLLDQAAGQPRQQ